MARQSRRGWLWPLLGLLFVGTLAFNLWFFLRSSGGEPQVRVRASAAPEKTMGTGPPPSQLRSLPAFLDPDADPDGDPDADPDYNSPKRCPGDVEVRDEEGRLVDGQLFHDSKWLPLVEGRATGIDRPCPTWRTLAAWEGDPVPSAAFTVSGEVERGELAVLTVPQLRHGFVQVRYADGRQPPGGWDTLVVSAGASATVSHEGEGRFRIDSDQEVLWVRARDLDGSERGNRLDLDGRVVELVLHGSREVALTLLCDDCPETVHCGSTRMSACEGEPPELRCACPPGAVKVHGKTMESLFDWRSVDEVLGGIPEGVTEWTLDRSGERGSIAARWAGEGECQVRLDLDGVVVDMYHFPCDEGAAFVLEDLRPGHFVLVVGSYERDGGRWRTLAEATVEVELGSGEHVDLGLIEAGELPEADTGSPQDAP